MMEGEAVEIFAPPFKSPQPKVARMALKINLLFKMNRALVLPPSKFRRANPTSDPSLEFCFFLSRKRREPFGGQPRQASAEEKQPVQKPPRPAGTPPMEGNCNRSLAIATLLA